MHNIIIYASALVISLYTGIGLWVFLGFYIPAKSKREHKGYRKISVIIPFRNEEKNLPALINSLERLDYPGENYELIFINDHSTDAGAELVEGSILKNSKLLHLQENEGKKAALALGISFSTGEMIATTDADCILPADWLREINSYPDADMILGPVTLKTGKNVLHIFQETEWAALQSLTAAACSWKLPVMNNGANLAYTKKNYREAGLKSFTASGDDIFMLEDFQQRKLRIVAGWETAHIVETAPVDSFKALIRQKVRWASKSKHTTHPGSKLIGYIVFFTNVLVLIHGILCLAGIFPFSFFIMFYTVKIVADTMMVLPYALLVKKSWLLLCLPFTGLVYPVYFLWIFAAALKGDYIWKGRSHHA